MEHCTKKPRDEKEIPAFGPDSIEMAMRLDSRHDRRAGERRGYRRMLYGETVAAVVHDRPRFTRK